MLHGALQQQLPAELRLSAWGLHRVGLGKSWVMCWVINKTALKMCQKRIATICDKKCANMCQLVVSKWFSFSPLGLGESGWVWYSIGCFYLAIHRPNGSQRPQDVVTFASAMSACNSGSAWRQSLELLEDLWRSDLEPNTVVAWPQRSPSLGRAVG